MLPDPKPAEPDSGPSLGSLPGFVYHCPGADRWTPDYLSQSFFDCTGVHPEALLGGQGRVYVDLIHPEDHEALSRSVREGLETGSGYELVYRLVLPGRGVRWFFERGCGHYGPDGSLLGLAGFASDLTGTDQTLSGRLQPPQRFRQLFDVIPEAITVLRPNGRLVELNAAARRLFGYRNSADCLDRQLEDLSLSSRSDGSSADVLAAALAQVLQQGEHAFHWVLPARGSGASHDLLVRLHRIRLDGETLLLARLNDIGAARRDDDRLRRLAYEDPLTGLPNRQAALEWLEGFLRRDRQQPLLLLNLDIDNFQWVNNTFGRARADQVIKAFAELLTEQVQMNGMVARLQSDEFLLMLPLPQAEERAGDDRSPEQVLHGLRRSLSSRLDERLDLPYAPTFCLGCRLYGGSVDAVAPPPQPLNADDLLQDVNTALSEARRSGVNRQAIYVPEMSRLIQKKLQLEARLAQARQMQEFTLHYQPIVRRDGVIVAAEALLRWPQDDGTFVPPDIFVPLLERSGRILDVGRWLMEAACEQLASWWDQDLPLDYLSINISAAQLLSKEAPLDHDLMRALQRYQLPASAMQLEITETAVLENIELARVQLERVASSGFEIALDDFGTGYSSLLTLLQLPISALKIDKTFVDEIDIKPKSYALVETCVSMADKLGLRCIAEGIESELQCQQLRRIGCQYFQGYLYDRPLPPAEMEERLRAQNLTT